MEWGYLFILLSSLFICVMSAVRKEYQRSFGATLKSTLVFIGVSSLFVCLIGLVYCLATDFAPVKQADGFIVGLSAIFALILTVNTCLGIFGSKYGSLAVLIMFATLGTLVISTAYGLIADPEDKYEEFETKQEAMSREYHIKKLKREEKIKLINQNNN